MLLCEELLNVENLSKTVYPWGLKTTELSCPSPLHHAVALQCLLIASMPWELYPVNGENRDEGEEDEGMTHVFSSHRCEAKDQTGHLNPITSGP